MVKHIITAFKGVVPRLRKENLGAGGAYRARDCDFSKSDLRGWRKPKHEMNLEAGTRAVFQYDCCWQASGNCADFAIWRPACARVMATGHLKYPSVISLHTDDKGNCAWGNECGGWVRLGVPFPSSPPHANPDRPFFDDGANLEGRTVKAVSYCYTYENCFCEEGAPSYPCDVIKTNDGTGFTITGFQLPPLEWGVKAINIYRSESGYDNDISQDLVSAQTGLTQFFMCGQIDVRGLTDAAPLSYHDSKSAPELGQTLTTAHNLPPPDDLTGLAAVPAGTTLAGWRKGADKEMWFCRHGESWVWPEAAVLTLDDHIRGIAPSGNGWWHVMTDGSPYAVQEEECEDEKKPRQVIRHQEPLPLLGCGTGSYNYVNTPYGTFYVSADGIVGLNGNSPPQIITGALFSSRDWRKLKPETMRLGFYQGTLFITSDKGSWCLSLNGTAFPNYENVHLSELSIRPEFYYTSRTGELFYAQDGRLWRWNAGAGQLPFEWESSEIETFFDFPIGVARVEGEGAVKATLIADEHVAWERGIVPYTTYRMPHYGRKRKHRVRLQGSGAVWRVFLGTARKDMIG